MTQNSQGNSSVEKLNGVIVVAERKSEPQRPAERSVASPKEVAEMPSAQASQTNRSAERLPVSQPRRSAERSDASQPVAGEMPSASVYQPHKSQDRSVLPVRDATDAAIH
jgi:hypothetical protein